MRTLDDIDVKTLLLLEAEATEQALDGFLEFIRGHYGLAALVYISPSFGRRRITDPFFAVAYADAWVEHREAQGPPASDRISIVCAAS